MRILRELPISGQNASGTTVEAVGAVSGSSTKRQTRMAVGKTFTNYDDGFSIKLNSITSGKSASVTVSFGSQAAASKVAAPKVSKQVSTTAVTLASATGKKGKTDEATITITVGGGVAPTGKYSLYINGSKKKTYTLKASSNGTVTITMPKFTSKGTKSVIIHYAGTSSIASSVSPDQKVKVG